MGMTILLLLLVAAFEPSRTAQSASTRICADRILDNNRAANDYECLLSGVKRTWSIAARISLMTQSGHRACAVPMSAFGGKADIASQLMTQKAEVIF